MVRKSPDDVLGSTLGIVSDPSDVFIRFTGGEPTLYWSEIVQNLGLFDANPRTCQIPVLIQTNGIEKASGISIRMIWNLPRDSRTCLSSP